jgi:hypothetical protein
MSGSATVIDGALVGANGGFLRPWQPGQSGNPSGKPNPLKAVQILCREKSLKSAQVLAEIAENPEEDSARRIVAADKILTWAFGKPPDYDPTSDRPAMLLDLSRLTAAQLTLVKHMIDSGAIRPAAEPVVADETNVVAGESK